MPGGAVPDHHQRRADRVAGSGECAAGGRRQLTTRWQRRDPRRKGPLPRWYS
jgi:hypothetical protein